MEYDTTLHYTSLLRVLACQLSEDYPNLDIWYDGIDEFDENFVTIEEYEDLLDNWGGPIHVMITRFDKSALTEHGLVQIANSSQPEITIEYDIYGEAWVIKTGDKEQLFDIADPNMMYVIYSAIEDVFPI